MPTKRVLVTGGAGFIGSHLVDALVKRGHDVTVLDAFVPQVHALGPQDLNPKARYLRGDVRSADAWKGALEGQEIVYHLAAAVGIGQSMYQVADFVNTNVVGTARLLEHLATRGSPSVGKLVVASSMSLYGEGAYECPQDGPVAPRLRSASEVRQGGLDPPCPRCAGPISAVATPETKPLDCTSVYALSKRDQEEYALLIGRTYGLPTVALRLFNVFGPRQALSNPYTGVCAIFSSRIKSGRPPVVYEDGRQTRDFVFVDDVVQAFLLAGETSGADYQALNIGSGEATSIGSLANILCQLYGSTQRPEISGAYRAGDIRHCTADIRKARERLGFAPRTTLREGLDLLARWAGGQAAVDRFDEAQQELVARGLLPRA